jgi:hypothetical protein
MPGLLQTDVTSSERLYAAIAAEVGLRMNGAVARLVLQTADLLVDRKKLKHLVLAAQFFCTLLFAFFGGAAPSGSAAAANGIALAVLGELSCPIDSKKPISAAC